MTSDASLDGDEPYLGSYPPSEADSGVNLPRPGNRAPTSWTRRKKVLIPVPFTGWESSENYLGMTRDKVFAIEGFRGERVPFDRDGFPDWSEYRIGLDVREYFPYVFARYILRLPKNPLGTYWVTLTQLREFLDFRKVHGPEYASYMRNRRARLGKRWNLNWFQLDEQEKFIVLMPEHELMEYFHPDPRGSVPFNKIGTDWEMLPPVLKVPSRVPPGFPLKGNRFGVNPTPNRIH